MYSLSVRFLPPSLASALADSPFHSDALPSLEAASREIVLMYASVSSCSAGTASMACSTPPSRTSMTVAISSEKWA